MPLVRRVSASKRVSAGMPRPPLHAPSLRSACARDRRVIADRQPRAQAANVLSTMVFAIQHAMPRRCCIHTPPEPAPAAAPARHATFCRLSCVETALAYYDIRTMRRALPDI